MKERHPEGQTSTSEICATNLSPGLQALLQTAQQSAAWTAKRASKVIQKAIIIDIKDARKIQEL